VFSVANAKAKTQSKLIRQILNFALRIQQNFTI